MGKTMYKGFDKDLKCRGYQYEEGKEYVHKDEEDGQDYIDLVKVAKVDGKRIKADTWYTLKEGKFVLADDDDY